MHQKSIIYQLILFVIVSCNSLLKAMDETDHLEPEKEVKMNFNYTAIAYNEHTNRIIAYNEKTKVFNIIPLDVKNQIVIKTETDKSYVLGTNIVTTQNGTLILGTKNGNFTKKKIDDSNALYSLNKGNDEGKIGFFNIEKEEFTGIKTKNGTYQPDAEEYFIAKTCTDMLGNNKAVIWGDKGKKIQKIWIINSKNVIINTISVNYNNSFNEEKPSFSDIQLSSDGSYLMVTLNDREMYYYNISELTQPKLIRIFTQNNSLKFSSRDPILFDNQAIFNIKTGEIKNDLSTTLGLTGEIIQVFNLINNTKLIVYKNENSDSVNICYLDDNKQTLIPLKTPNYTSKINTQIRKDQITGELQIGVFEQNNFDKTTHMCFYSTLMQKKNESSPSCIIS